MKYLTWFFVLFFLLTCSTVALAERMMVDVKLANIRKGPGTNTPILWKVEIHHPIETIKKTGNWYYFKDFEGDVGYIHESLVSKTESVITVKDKCNIRTGPGLKNDIAFTAERGVSFKVMERKGDWIHIEHADGDKGWIYKTLVW